MIRIGREIQCLPYAGFFFTNFFHLLFLIQAKLPYINTYLQSLLFSLFSQSQSIGNTIHSITQHVNTHSYNTSIRLNKLKHSEANSEFFVYIFFSSHTNWPTQPPPTYFYNTKPSFTNPTVKLTKNISAVLMFF